MLDCSTLEVLKTPASFLATILSSIDRSEHPFTDVDCPRIAAIRGIVSLKSGDYRAAEEFFTIAFESSNDPMLLWLRAKCRLENNAFAAAEEDCLKCITLDSHFILARLTLDALYVKSSRMDDAAMALAAVQEVDGNSEASYINYLQALIALKRNNWTAAREYSRRSIIDQATLQEVPPSVLWKI